MPGGTVRGLTYTAWKQLTFNSIDAANAALSGPLVDGDRDGLPNYAEYVLGRVPAYADSAGALPSVQIENISGTDYLTFQYRLNAGATEAMEADAAAAAGGADARAAADGAGVPAWAGGAARAVPAVAMANASSTPKARVSAGICRHTGGTRATPLRK